MVARCWAAVAQDLTFCFERTADVCGGSGSTKLEVSKTSPLL